MQLDRKNEGGIYISFLQEMLKSARIIERSYVPLYLPEISHLGSYKLNEYKTLVNINSFHTFGS